MSLCSITGYTSGIERYSRSRNKRSCSHIAHQVLFYFKWLNNKFSKCTSLLDTTSSHSNTISHTELPCDLEQEPKGYGAVSN